MGGKRLILLMLLLFFGIFQQTGIAQDKTTSAESKPATEPKPDEQLEINKNTLLKGPSEDIRVKAATVMLYSSDPLARKIILDTLKQSENAAARAAVCKALIQTRAAQKPIENKQEFIQPLFEMLASTDDSTGARLAAESTLIFRYDQIQELIERFVTDASLPLKARLNAIYTLRLHPDIKAIFKLLNLLDDPDSQVASASQTALNSMGIPASKDPEARKKIISELEGQGLDAFLRDRLITRETEIRRLETRLSVWQERYLSALDKIYDSTTDDAAKGKFLAEQLSVSESLMKLWALDKISQRRTGTNPKLPIELGPILMNLISDQDRNVRLKTARLLALMGELDTAQQLLEQLKIEQDDEVKTELFVALGRACYLALLPDAKFKISVDIRKQTLEWAVKYLSEQDPQKVRKGAEVIRRLLEQDGLTAEEVDRCLVLLVERFNQQGSIAEGALRGELLSAMTGLCAPQSFHNAQAKKHFRPLFEKALSDKTDLVREAAVDGLIYIDKAGALKDLRKNYINDNSVIVRKKLIDLAGEVGSKEDLTWLAGKIGSNAESEPAWQAMLKIFNSSDAAVLNEWTDVFFSENSQYRLSDEQKSAFLEIAERKAISENKQDIIKSVRDKLAAIYFKIGQYERAADYLGKLYEAAKTGREKEEILPRLLSAYLRWSKMEAAAKLVENRLLEKDVEPQCLITRAIDDYINNPPAGANTQELLKILSGIKLPVERPIWRQQIIDWNERIKTSEAEKDLDIPTIE